MSSSSSGGQSEGGGSTPSPGSDDDVVHVSRRLGCFARGGVPNKVKRHVVTFPDKVPAVVRDAIEQYDIPKGYKLVPAGPGSNVSVLNYWGVRIVHQDATPDATGAVKQKWVCLASAECRRNKDKLLAVTSAQTSNATVHLRRHNLVSDKTEASNIKKSKAEANKEASLTSALRQDDPQRFSKLEFVKAVFVHSMVPFQFAEDERVRHMFSITSPSLDVTGLHRKASKVCIAEMYAATTRVFKTSMLKTVRAALIPIVYINIDLWTSKVSGDKYLGNRIFYLDENMVLHSHLLGLKEFRPALSAGAKLTGKVVEQWAMLSLAEFGLTEEDIAGAVTDAGTDIRSGIGSTFKWEWCIPHLLNRATTDGAGMSLDKTKSKNALCRDLMDVTKKVVEHFNKSVADKIGLEDSIQETSKGKGSKAKLSQAVHQRWVSLAKMVQRVLAKWEKIEMFYIGTLKAAFPLAGRKDEMEEVYTILHAVKVCIEYCQTTGEPTGQNGLQRLVVLMTKVLEPDSPLLVEHVPMIGQEKQDCPPSELRKPADLTETGKATRLAFHKAVAERVIKPRYGKGLDKHSHLFDQAMLLSPSGRSLRYLDTLKAARVGETGGFVVDPVVAKTRVTDQLTSLVARAVQSRRTRDDSKENCGDASRAKRLKSTKEARPVEMQEMREAGMFDSDDGDDDDTPAECLTPLEEADAIVTKWKNAKIPNGFKTEMSAANTCAYWRQHGDSLSPDLRRVAQSVMGAPASAAVLERDFCVAGQVVSRKRGSLDPAYVEVLLFLRANIDLIPREIPKLTGEELATAIPERLRDPAKLEEVRALYVSPEDDDVPTDASEEIDLCDDEPVVRKRALNGKARGAETSGGAGNRNNNGLSPCVDPSCENSEPISGIHKCLRCNGNMHAFCGKPAGEEGFGQSRLCEGCDGS